LIRNKWGIIRIIGERVPNGKAFPVQHFPIIQALCRAALADPSPAVRKQVERLREALIKEGGRG
jgi:hypothetical protein